MRSWMQSHYFGVDLEQSIIMTLAQTWRER